MAETIFLDFMGDSPEMRVMDYLVTCRGLDFCFTDIADNAHVSRPTLYKIWDGMLKHEIVVYTRTIGKSKLYKLNEANPAVQKLIEIDKYLMNKELERVKKRYSPKKRKVKSVAR